MAGAYQPWPRDHALTLALLRRADRPVVFEGVPGIGKSTAIECTANSLRDKGCQVIVHEEQRHEQLLQEVEKDPKGCAGWFQLVKLFERETELAKVQDSIAREPGTIHLIDRSLPGDYSFFLYHHQHGNITPTLAAAYKQELEKIHATPPLLVIYLYSEPSVVRARIEERGVDWEKKMYDETFCREMHELHLKSLQELNVPYATVDWSEHYAKGHVPPDRCLSMLTNALRDVYGNEWDKLA